jgi:hypothetical protein
MCFGKLDIGGVPAGLKRGRGACAVWIALLDWQAFPQWVDGALPNF